MWSTTRLFPDIAYLLNKHLLQKPRLHFALPSLQTAVASIVFCLQ